MKIFLKFISIFFLASSLVITGCGGGGGGGGDDDDALVADAGADVKVRASEGSITLDGSANTSDDAGLTYTWTPPPGTTLTGEGPNPQLAFSSPGIYPVSLVVSDGSRTSFPDIVTVTAFDTIPDAAIRPLGQSALAMEGEENGGFYVLGTVADAEDPNLTDIYVQRTSSDGTTVSEKQLGPGNSLDFPAGLAVLGAGRVAIVGTIEEDIDPSTNAPGDIYLAVVDLSGSGEGTVLYENDNLARSGDDLAASIRVTQDGGLLISGSSVLGDGSQVMRFIRFGPDAQTTVQPATWDIFVDAPDGSVDYGIDALEESPNEVIILGDTLSAGQDFMYLARVNVSDPLDPAVTPLNLIGDQGAEVSLALEKTTNGYLIVGSSNSFGLGGYDILAIRTDQDGQYGGQLSEYAIGGGRNDFSVYARKVNQTPSGFLITGVTQPVENASDPDYDTVLLSFDSEGNRENMGVYAFEGFTDEVGLFARETSPGAYELAGVRGVLSFANPAEFNVTAGDFFTVDLDSGLRVIE